MLVKVKILKAKFGYAKDQIVELEEAEAKELVDAKLAEVVTVTATEEAGKEIAKQLNETIEKEVKKQIASISSNLKKETKIEVGADLQTDSPTAGFKHLGEYALCVKKATEGQGLDPRLEKWYNKTGVKAATGLVGGDSDPQAAGTLPEQFAGQIVKNLVSDDSLIPYVQKFPMSVGRNLKIPVFKDYDRGSATATARIVDYAVTDTAAGRSAVTVSRPNFETVNLSLNKRAALVPATEELLEDNGVALGVFLNMAIADQLRARVNEGIIRGVANFSDGVIGHAATLTLARQVNDTIETDDVTAMRARFYGDYNKAVWVCSHSAYNPILGLTLGNYPMFLPQGIHGAPTDMLLGRPLVKSEYASSVGDTGDLILMDGSKYWAAVKGNGASNDVNIELAQSIHLYFNLAEQAFRGVIRWDGRPIFSSIFTLANGDKVSPFIELSAGTSNDDLNS